jgi:hypothetical protein
LYLFSTRQASATNSLLLSILTNLVTLFYSLLRSLLDPGNDSRYVKYVQDMPVSWFESFIRSLAHGKVEVHRALPKTESLKDCK